MIKSEKKTKAKLKRKKKQLNKRKEKKEKDVNEFRELIKDHNDKIWCPNYDIRLTNINTKSCFDFSKYESEIKKDCIVVIEKNTTKKIVKSIIVDMILNDAQKIIINRWFLAYIRMYNETVRFIKNNYKKNNKFKIYYKTIRTKNLKDIKDLILKESQLLNYKKKMTIKSHMLDGAIRLACANYNSAVTNLIRGNIKHFRMRYWKYNKSNKIIDIEPIYFRNGTICESILGKIKCIYNNKDFDLNLIKTKYKSECKIYYNSDLDKYQLLVPEEIIINKMPIKREHKVISLDPGIRTFMTGLSENEVIKIGQEISNKIIEYLKRIDNAKYNINIPIKIKKKIEKLYNRKISNMINEMHWKVINYLTNNYDNVLIGNMSVKSIINNKTSVLSDMLKRVALKLKFFQFRQRLEFKCNERNVNYKLINESYTSKMCSLCGHCKDDLGGSKIYNCENCNIKMDRDVNGSRGIYIKSFKKTEEPN